MTAVAFYNLKGGVGKTTAAVNVAYLAAANGQRVLLWDLDPQGSSSFILRVRAHVGDIRKKAFRGGEMFADAIKETDYRNLDLLPADFSYRKFERILDHLGNPTRVMRTLLETLGADYDVLVLDCPAGFSLLTEAILETADLTLVPTIPTPLAVQTLARILKWAERCGSSSCLAPFFSMVDRRKTLHRRACEWSSAHPGNFLNAQIPYASVVEQLSVRRTPLPEFAERDPATAAFVELSCEVHAKLEQRRRDRGPTAGGHPAVATIQSLSVELESVLAREAVASPSAVRERPTAGADTVIHAFDTEHRTLTASGHVLELHESPAGMAVVVERIDGKSADDVSRVEVQIDGSWALRILSGEMSPLVVLERRLGRPGPPLLRELRAAIGKRRLCRSDSRLDCVEFPTAASA